MYVVCSCILVEPKNKTRNKKEFREYVLTAQQL